MSKGERFVATPVTVARLRRLVLTAIFSDDDFLQKMALKGGGALDMIYGIGSRASIDLDFSVSGEFSQTPEELRVRFEGLLARQFRPEQLHVFDVEIEQKPRVVSADLKGFWGGYSLSFKLIPEARLKVLGTDLERLRREALPTSPLSNATSFQVDLSLHEYLGEGAVQSADSDGYAISVYTPAALAIEKLRAICQQMPEYAPVIRRRREPSPRPQDFYDITLLKTRFPAECAVSPSTAILLRCIFAAKRVPVGLLLRLGDPAVRSLHAGKWQTVIDSVSGRAPDQFASYFEGVVEYGERLYEALRKADLPPG